MSLSLDHIKQDIEHFALEGGKIVVGVSGGRDSMALLHVLHNFSMRLVVAHVNYGLRGADSEADEQLVRGYCERHGLTLAVHTADPEVLNQTNIQAEARRIRYTFFEELMALHGAKAIAIAHHKDDQLETIFFRFLRGGGLASIRGMKRFDRGIWRPFLNATRASIDAYVHAFAVPYRDDASNFEEDYVRNKLRHKVLPELDTAVPQWKSALIHRASMVEEVEEYLESTFLNDLTWVSELADGSYVLDIGLLLRLPIPHYRLWHFLAQKDLPATSVRAVLDLNDSGSGSRVELRNWRFMRERVGIRMVHQTERAAVSQRWIVQEFPAQIAEWDVSLHGYDEVKDQLTEGRVILRHDVLKFPLEVRAPKGGDMIQPFGMTGTKSVARLLIQKKIEQSDKGKIRVWANGSEVYWVEGLTVSELCRARSGDRVALFQKRELI